MVPLENENGKSGGRYAGPAPALAESSWYEFAEAEDDPDFGLLGTSWWLILRFEDAVDNTLVRRCSHSSCID